MSYEKRVCVERSWGQTRFVGKQEVGSGSKSRPSMISKVKGKARIFVPRSEGAG
jgi:hypothetical protein